MTAPVTAGDDDEASVGGHLAENIAHFGRALRRAGLPVGPGQVLDAVEALGVAGIGTREDLYWVLHGVFVTRREHAVVFDQAFRLFFRRRALLERMMSMLMPAAPGDPTRHQEMLRRVQEALAAPAEAKGDVKPPERRRDARLSASDREVLASKDFEQMSAAELLAARRAIAALVLPLDRVPTRRFVASPRAARIDARRSLVATVRGGGDLLTLRYRQRDNVHPPVVALVDISESMRAYGRMFLHFLHALRLAGRDVRAFTFATDLTPVSRYLAAHRDPDEALAACAKGVRDWDGGTRIGVALDRFNRRWSRRVLSGGPIVLLLTDGLERPRPGEGLEPLARAADRLHRSCRRLIWLNPLLRYEGFEARAGGVRALLPHVDEFRSLHNLKAVDDLVRALARPADAAHDPRAWLRAVA